MKKYIEIGSRLRKLRAHLSQKKFAEQLGIPFRTYQRYETGERIPKGPALQEIAEVCDVTTDYILTGDEESLRHHLLKQTRDLQADAGELIARMPKMLGEIDPALEKIFPHWADISKEDKEAVLQYVFYKKKVEKIFNKVDDKKGGMK
jgi:transcriptional regulator with XRE-family HTH domain